MFAWIDLAWLAGGLALGVRYKDKIMAAVQGAEAYSAKLKATASALEAKATAAKATVQADVAAVESKAAAVESAVKS